MALSTLIFLLIFAAGWFLLGFGLGGYLEQSRTPKDLQHLRQLLNDLNNEQMSDDDMHIDGIINDDFYEDQSDTRTIIRE